MNWGNIQNEWQTSNGIPGEAEIQRMAQSAQERSRNVHRAVKRRDLIETTAALLIAPMFGFWAWSALGKGLIYLLNQRAATRKFIPTIEQIDRQIEELSDGITQGETT